MLTRSISKVEYEAIAQGRVPAYDAVIKISGSDKFMTVRNKKVGINDSDFTPVLDNLYSEIKILDNGCMIAKYEDVYLIFDSNGYLIKTEGFAKESEAASYATFF